MVFKVPGRTNLLSIIAFVLAISGFNSCRMEGSVPVNRWINGDTVQISSSRGITSFNCNIANGVLFCLNERRDTILRKEYRDGKEDGITISWYDNGNVCEVRKFVNGNKTGTHFGWYSNGTPKFIYHFENDLYEGEYIEWYSNGQLFRKQNFVRGHENGRQQIWFEGGQIKSNYIIKNNKRYGLFGTQNCSNVADSIST